MADYYDFPSSPSYSTEIARLKRSDPADAETVFNPLLQQILYNIHYVKLTMESGRLVVAERERDASKPTYGLDTETDDITLETSTYSGASRVSATISGVEYDASNLTDSEGDTGADGTLIFSAVEEN